MMNAILRSWLAAGLLVTLQAQAATSVVTSPSRAIASYASEVKSTVNVRGLSDGRDNCSRIRLKCRGMLLIIR